ncbi:hypothetical protein KIPB_014760, partial [Kipferlia bialata]|eukprot:g14760.t1
MDSQLPPSLGELSVNEYTDLSDSTIDALPLPSHYTARRGAQEVLYVNTRTGDTSPEHPLVERAREEAALSPLPGI